MYQSCFCLARLASVIVRSGLVRCCFVYSGVCMIGSSRRVVLLLDGGCFFFCVTLVVGVHVFVPPACGLRTGAFCLLFVARFRENAGPSAPRATAAIAAGGKPGRAGSRQGRTVPGEVFIYESDGMVEYAPHSVVPVCCVVWCGAHGALEDKAKRNVASVRRCLGL